MTKATDSKLSRRERQIMDILYERGRASVAEVVEAMSDAPSYSAVRALLRVLEEKGHIAHTSDGPRYVYMPKRRRRHAGRSALKRALKTFYGGSVAEAVAGLLDAADAKLDSEDLDRLAELVDKARKEQSQ